MAFHDLAESEFIRFQNLLETFYKNNTILKSNNCHIWTGLTLNNGYGRISLTINEKNGLTVSKKIYVHRFVYLVYNKDFKHHMDYNKDCGLSISHLCGQKKCVNIKHLIFEPSWLNNSRRICHREKRCSGHNCHPDHEYANLKDCIIVKTTYK